MKEVFFIWTLSLLFLFFKNNIQNKFKGIEKKYRNTNKTINIDNETNIENILLKIKNAENKQKIIQTIQISKVIILILLYYICISVYSFFYGNEIFSYNIKYVFLVILVLQSLLWKLVKNHCRKAFFCHTNT